jgi:hypothetical protein
MNQPTPRGAHAFRLCLVLCSSFCLPACASFEENEYVGETTYRLNERRQPDGTSISYQLRVEPNAEAYLDIVREGNEPYTEVGLHTVELDRSRAKGSGDRPYAGLLVLRVDKDSPGHRAGIKAGEVLVSIKGKPVYYNNDYNTALVELSVGQPSTFEVRAAGEGQPTRPVDVVPESRMRKDRKLDRVRLEAPEVRNPKPYAGVVVRRFPPEYTKDVFGQEDPVLVISGVALGSPAYLAGIRAGDVILNIDGRPAPELAEFQSMLRKKGPAEELIAFDVHSQLGEYRAQVELADYSGSSRSSLWLVWSTSSSARRTAWNFILGGWLVGYENSYVPTRTRAPAERGHFTMLLGLFKREWSESGSRTRLLWFINFR